MATYVEVGRGPVELDQAHFVAQGGEGAVYCRDGVAYKVFHDADRALPQGKLRLLAALDAPTVVRPERLLLRDGAPAGYAMRWIPDARPLAPFFTPAFRRRNAVTAEAVAALVESMRRTVAHAHARGALVVDLNDLNCLVPPSHDRAYFIDVDSWQVPGFPATALLDTVRDRHATAFHEGSDWFSWAVVTFQLWLGVHPYKGKHPTLTTLEDRMQADASVFDPAVTLPPACPPLDVVPARLRGWYEAVFERRHRDPPPAEHGAAAVAVPRPLRPGQHLVITPLRTYDGPVRAFGSAFGVAVAVTDRSAWIDAHRVGPAPAGQPAIGFDRQGRPVVAALHAGRVTAWQNGAVRGEVAARALVGHAGHLHALVGDRVVALEVRAGTLLGRPVARVLPRAAQLFPGVVVQHLLGAAWVTLLPSGRQVRVPELDGHRVLDAAHAGGVLLVLAARDGAWHRLTVRVGAELDVQVDADVERPEINAAVLDRGILVRLDDDDALTLLPATAHAPGERRVADPALGADLALATHDGGLVALRGDTLLGLALRDDTVAGMSDDDDAIAAWRRQQYPRPALTVDLVVFTVLDADLKVLLIRRGEAPFRHAWALPGGFVRVGDGGADEGEDLDAAAHRELVEETGLPEGSVFLEQLYTFGRRGRDPRGRVVTVAYYALVRPDLAPLVTAGTDAEHAEWRSVAHVDRATLAFDHAEILDTAVERIRGKLDYAPIAFDLVPATFSVSELRAVHEAIKGEADDPSNFRRRFRRMVEDGLIEQAPGKRITGRRPAAVYRFVRR